MEVAEPQSHCGTSRASSGDTSSNFGGRDRGPRSARRWSRPSAPPRFAVIVTRRLRCATRTSVSAEAERPTAPATSSTRSSPSPRPSISRRRPARLRRFRSRRPPAAAPSPSRPARVACAARASVPEPLLDVLRVGLVPQEFREPPRLPRRPRAASPRRAPPRPPRAARRRGSSLSMHLLRMPRSKRSPAGAADKPSVGRLALLVEPVPHGRRICSSPRCMSLWSRRRAVCTAAPRASPRPPPPVRRAQP